MICKVCGEKARGEYCWRHKRRKPINKVSKASATKSPAKKVKPQSKRRKSVKRLKEALDRIFSTFVRLRDADKKGYVTCFTSGKKMWWRESQCGHFMSRRHNSTRWHEKNCHAQCPHSNLYLSGEQYVYGQNLDKVYGEGTADELVALSRQDFKLTIDWLEEQIAYYTERVQEIRGDKNL